MNTALKRNGELPTKEELLPVLNDVFPEMTFCTTDSGVKAFHKKEVFYVNRPAEFNWCKVEYTVYLISDLLLHLGIDAAEIVNVRTVRLYERLTEVYGNLDNPADKMDKQAFLRLLDKGIAARGLRERFTVKTR